jgi:hypothetical protein
MEAKFKDERVDDEEGLHRSQPYCRTLYKIFISDILNEKIKLAVNLIERYH